MFTLKIKTDNAAFADGNRFDEVARILRDTANFLTEQHPTAGRLRDSNGNGVGEFKFSGKA